MNAMPIVDHARLDLISAGDAGLRAELTCLFDEVASRYAQTAEQAAAANDTILLARATHGLGGAATNIGAARLGALAAEAESRAKAGEIAFELVAEMNDVLEATRLELARRFEG